MNISIFGLGYVGCVSLGCLAKSEHKVIGVDISEYKVKLINQGKPTIIEHGIDVLIRDGISNQKIHATSDYCQAVANSDISIIAVGTPSTPEGHLNLNSIYSVARQIGEGIKKKDNFHIISIRSTVLPGTNDTVGKIIAETSGKIRNNDFAIVSNPEFLREGSAVNDFFNPPVTVIGSDNELAAHKIAALYSETNGAVKTVPIKVAEMIKYVNNSFHALKVTFANEVGSVCKALGIDSHTLMDLFVMDKQLNISPYYLKPGFSYGGSCLPKDLKGLTTIAHDHYINTPVLSSIEASNSSHKKSVIELIEIKGKKQLGIIGLSFKEGTDDLRYSPTVELAEYFLGKGYKLNIFDGNVSVSKLTGTNKNYIQQHIPHLSNIISNDLDAVIQSSELVVIAHKIHHLENMISKYPHIYFIDLARVTNQSHPNYEGICW